MATGQGNQTAVRFVNALTDAKATIESGPQEQARRCPVDIPSNTMVSAFLRQGYTVLFGCDDGVSAPITIPIDRPGQICVLLDRDGGKLSAPLSPPEPVATAACGQGQEPNAPMQGAPGDPFSTLGPAPFTTGGRL